MEGPKHDAVGTGLKTTAADVSIGSCSGQRQAGRQAGRQQQHLQPKFGNDQVQQQQQNTAKMDLPKCHIVAKHASSISAADLVLL